MRLGYKILIPHLLLLALLLIASGLLFLDLREQDEGLRVTRQQLEGATRLAGRVKDLFTATAVAVLSYRLDRDPRRLEAMTLAEAEAAGVLEAHGHARLDPRERALLSALVESRDRIRDSRIGFVRAIDSGSEGAIQAAFGKWQIHRRLLDANLDDFSVFSLDRFAAATEQVARDRVAIIYYLLYGVAIAIAIAVAAFFYVRGAMVRPLAMLVRGIATFGGGKLGARIDPRMEQSQDEIGHLARAFNGMAVEIEHLVADSQLRERRFRALVEHSSDAITIIDAGNKILYQSPSVQTVEGYSVEELVGRNGLESTHPDDVPLVREIVRQVLERPGLAVPCTWRRRHKDGRWLWLEGVATNLLDDPAVRGIVTNYRDVTERMDAEQALHLAHERLRRFVDSNIVGIVIAEADGGIVETNDYYLRLIGYSREEFERGAIDWRTITPPEWRAVDEQALEELRERGTCTPYEKEYARRDGTRVQVFLADAMLPRPDRQIAAFVLDITDRKRAEAEIRELNSTLEQRVRERTTELDAANKELSAFAYSVSHDLRSPLRTIDGFSKILEEDYGSRVDDEGRDSLHRVRAAAQKMGGLIDDLLKLSRLSRSEMTREQVDLNALARGIAEELRTGDPGRNVTFDIAPGLGVRGDKALLMILLENLMGNAWKFTSKHASARIEVGVTEKEGQPVYFVRDDGAGFDMAHVGTLFAPFQRLHGMAEFPGTGIGLATVRRVVQRHGGRAWAEGEVEKGATFYFTLGTEDDEAKAKGRETALA